VTVPDLPAVEAYHAAVIAAIDADGCSYGGCRVCKWCKRSALVQRQADRALARLRRHHGVRYLTPSIPAKCLRCAEPPWPDSDHYEPMLWPCPDALDAWADLTDISATCGVTA
jgi:hypothetical protein